MLKLLPQQRLFLTSLLLAALVHLVLLFFLPIQLSKATNTAANISSAKAPINLVFVPPTISLIKEKTEITPEETPATSAKKPAPAKLTTSAQPKPPPSKPQITAVNAAINEKETATTRPNITTGLASRSLNQAGLFTYNQNIKRLTPSSRLTGEEKLYIEAWQAKIERVGRLNFPAEVAKQKLSGKLRLAVLINTNGSLAKVELINSSGNEVLDQAAIHLVNLAAPFAPLPTSLQQANQQLEISRNWRIGSGLSAN